MSVRSSVIAFRLFPAPETQALPGSNLTLGLRRSKVRKCILTEVAAVRADFGRRAEAVAAEQKISEEAGALYQ